MANAISTIYGASLQAAHLRSLPLDYPENTTLNQKFNIYPDSVPTVGTLPTMKYFAIGRGGHRHVVGGDGAPLNQLEWHRASHSALYSHLPFVVRPIANDLSAGERENYALRRVETHNAEQHYVYYLKRMIPGTDSPKLLLTTFENGIPTTTPYVPSSEDLNPTPPELDPDGSVPVSGQYLSATSPVSLTLTAVDISELINAVSIIYGNTAYAMISEVALVSGVDRTVTIDVNGSSASFEEAIVAQCNALQCTGPHDLNSISTRLDLSYELGASEMLAI